MCVCLCWQVGQGRESLGVPDPVGVRPGVEGRSWGWPVPPDTECCFPPPGIKPEVVVKMEPEDDLYGECSQSYSGQGLSDDPYSCE